MAMLGSALALVSLFSDPLQWNNLYADMLRFDGYALAFSAVAILSTVLIIGLSGWGFRDLHATLGDNYSLLLFSTCGALCMFSFTNMVMLFLGIEILSIPLYVLAGSRRNDLSGNEAALKYFLLGAFATGILLFGIALVYGATASFDLPEIARTIAAGSNSPMMLHVGILLILIGLCFKVSAVPFHFWAPDVYTGSPNLVATYMLTVVKVAGFAAFFRLFSMAFPGAIQTWGLPVSIVAALTMTLANTTALFQSQFKRMMAYSSIAHAGYLLLAILSCNTPGTDKALVFYLLSYALATICAFGVYIAVAEQKNDGSFEAFNGLGQTRPFLAAIMAISMLSLAGIPPLAGFFGKYFLFTAAFEQYPWLVVLAVINSAISIYYYFKVIIAAYFNKPHETLVAEPVEVPAGIRWTVIAGIALTVLLTVAPYLAFVLI